MLDNIMVYWLNNASSSGRLYWHSFGKGQQPTQVHVPMGGTVFPKEIFRTSQRFAERIYTNIIYWNEALRRPLCRLRATDTYVEEVRACLHSSATSALRLKAHPPR